MVPTNGGQGMLLEITTEEFAAALDAVVEQVLDEARILGPPIDSLTVAARLGIAVAWDERQEGRGRCVRLRGYADRAARPAILVRPDQRHEREHWAVAHEIGEHVTHRVFTALSVDPAETPPGARETIANRLASRLLLPTRWLFDAVIESGWDLTQLKMVFASASHELIARRMLDFAPPVIVTLYDQGQITFRRSNVPGRVPPPSPVESRCRDEAHRRGEPIGESDGPVEITAWPIHEPHWQREIVRTALAEWDY
ncbi:MAG: ImmA/IrrE family metallo-endopeptidase [Pirellulaceae bacterium]|nr:ImmA/IrrE family metallo-endopeptidase [Pirellulaceae bacterium]